MRNLLVGCLVLASWAFFGWSLVVESSPRPIVAPGRAEVASSPCDSLGGTDWCECLSQPEACRHENPTLYYAVYPSAQGR